MESGFAEAVAGQSECFAERTVGRTGKVCRGRRNELSVSGLADSATAVQVGRLLGADRLLYGSFVEFGDNLRIDLRLADTKTASVLRAESASGPTKQFDELLEDLAMRLAADLAIRPPTNADNLVRAASLCGEHRRPPSISRMLSNRLITVGTPRRRAVLSVYCLSSRTTFTPVSDDRRAGSFKKNMRRPARPVNTRSKLSFLPEQSALKEEAYYQTHEVPTGTHSKYSDDIRIYDRLLQEFPLKWTQRGGHAGDACNGIACTWGAGRSSCRIGGRRQGRKRSPTRAEVLRCSLHVAHVLHAREGVHRRFARIPRTERRSGIPACRQPCGRSMQPNDSSELFEVMMKELEGRRDGHARMWAYNCGLHGLTTVWIYESGRTQRFFTSEQRKERLLRIVKTFSWATDVCYEAHSKLADVSDYLGDWEQESSRISTWLIIPNIILLRTLCPYRRPVGHYAPSDAICSQIYSRFKIASILRDHKQQPDVAIREFQKLIHDFGVTNYRGVNTVAALDKLGHPSNSRRKRLWCGRRSHGAGRVGPRARAAWVYGASRRAVSDYSAADLAPYQIVIPGQNRTAAVRTDRRIGLYGRTWPLAGPYWSSFPRGCITHRPAFTIPC